MEGDIDVSYLTEREYFREVLLKDRLHDAAGGETANIPLSA